MTIRRATAADRDALLGVWQRAVRATHDFVRPEHLAAMTPEVHRYLGSDAELWVACDDAGAAMGFMGLANDAMETLFLAPEFHRRGVGRRLVEHARAGRHELRVVVNEQNAGACRFYAACGFQIDGRSALDEQGRPYPILHLRWARSDPRHRTVETNGIRMHVAEQGAGPLVVLCHGFPELWYAWRHQLPALAAAGFRAVAPDQRGYGGTDRPDDPSAYTILHCAGDIVGLVDALGEREAVIVGHDWGAPVAWTCALLRPDVFRAVALLGVPYHPRGDVRPTEAMRAFAGERQFYQEYFQRPGVAEAELEADVRTNLLRFMWSTSGDAPPERRWHVLFAKDAGCLDGMTPPDRLPPWLTDADLDVVAREFERTGFGGGLSWYRNVDRSWELTAFLRGARLRQPSLFMAGGEDIGADMLRAGWDTLETAMPGLRRKVLLPGAGHWLPQERPDEVSALLVEFLRSLA